MRHGSFGWHELTTPDPQAALDFYVPFARWTTRPHPGGRDYTVLQVGDWGVGGVTSARPGVSPGWTGYVHVDDVDAAATRAGELGGRVLEEPSKVPGGPRHARLADPQGGAFVVFGDLPPAGPGAPLRPSREARGMFDWAELLTTEREAACQFYEALFGWKRSFAIPLGPFGAYQVMAVDGEDVVGIMAKAPDAEVGWGFYIRVGSGAEAVAHIRAGGGTVFSSPYQAPGDRWAAQARDPDGAVFGLLSSRA